MFSEFRHSL